MKVYFNTPYVQKYSLTCGRKKLFVDGKGERKSRSRRGKVKSTTKRYGEKVGKVRESFYFEMRLFFIDTLKW